ncbi:MAG: hypothetical protein MUE82_06660 [Chloroflexi bacterium]|nr:hypothetical protein [Chloroflexota bacterium]
MSDRLPPPGPSFLKEVEVRIGDATLRAGMGVPSALPDGWWIALLWVADADGIVSCRALAPASGPPPDPPAARIGIVLAGGLSGLAAEEGGRQAVKVRTPIPSSSEERPWDRPAVVQLAVRWDPVRAASARPTELASAALRAFASAVASLPHG